MPTLDMQFGIVVLACLVGIVGRTVIPYLQTLKDNPETKFDRKFFVPAVVAVLVNVFLVPLVLSTLPKGADWITAYLAGWSVTDQARELTVFLAKNVKPLNWAK